MIRANEARVITDVFLENSKKPKSYKDQVALNIMARCKSGKNTCIHKYYPDLQELLEESGFEVQENDNGYMLISW